MLYVSSPKVPDQYTPAGGSVHLIVRCDDELATISVRDTGIGIAAENLTHIFDRFYCVPDAKRKTGRGAGLGLALTQWIAEQHNTSINVKSQPQVGSQFSFILPILTGDTYSSKAIHEVKNFLL